MADHAALIERLEALTGPDAETDWLITQWADPGAVRHSSAHQHYTRSLDAVIALVERELPGWCVDCLQHMRGEDMWNAALRDDKADIDPMTKCPPRRWGFGATASIALCIALLKAKGGDNG